MNHSELARWAKISVLSLFAACASTDKQTGAEIVPIIAVGTGWTPPEAREDALLRATEDAVGSYLFAETTLSNEELHEQIVNFRAGIIEHYVVLTSEQLSDGRWSIKVLADVNTMPITSNFMTTAAVTEETVDAATLVKTTLARKRSREQFIRGARAALGEVLKGFPEEFLSLEPSGELSIIDSSSSTTALVEVRYQLDYDKDGFEKGFLPAFAKLAEDIGREVNHLSEDLPDSSLIKAMLAPLELILGDDLLVFMRRRIGDEALGDVRDDYKSLMNINNGHLVLVSPGPNWVNNGIYLKPYRIDVESAEGLRKAWMPKGEVRARLIGLGSQGTVLFEEFVPLGLENAAYAFITPFGPGEGYGTLICPFPASGERGTQIVAKLSPPVTFRFQIPYDTLEKVKSLQVDVSRRD